MHRENVMFQSIDPCNTNPKLKCYCDPNSLDYYQEIEKYKSQLKESHGNSSKLENEISDIKDRYKKEISKLNDEISRHKEKYERLHESHKRISRLNHDLEERILNSIDKFNSEKSEFKENYKEILSKYEAAQSFIADLQNECERYRNDCIIAVQLLQNNPSSFLSRHIETLPIYLKNRLNHFQKAVDMQYSFQQATPYPPQYSNNAGHHQFTNPASSSNNFISLTTFPPTAMLYSDYPIDQKSGQNQNHVCASVLAEVLHPDKVANHEKSVSEMTKCTIEIVCNKCGTVKNFRNACVQTFPHSSLSEKIYQKPNAKPNQNMIFDV